jgi:hypothetical protein
MISFRSLFVIILIIGMMIVVSEITKMTFSCPTKPEIEYRYMPRTLDIDVADSKDVDKIFKTMFQKAEPWVGTSRADAQKIRRIKQKDI